MLAREEYYYYAPQPQYIPEAIVEEPVVEQPPLVKIELNTDLRAKLGVLLVLVGLLAMGVTVLTGFSAQRGYALVDTQRKARELEESNERLQIKIAELKAPNRIQSIAANQLGMQVPAVTYFSNEGE